MRDEKIYNFFHKDHGVVQSIRYDLYTEYSLNPKSLYKVIKGINKHTKGWRLLKDGEDPYYQLKGHHHPLLDKKIYKFVHKDLGIQYLTRQRLRDKYNLRYKSLSKVIYGERNHTGGWYLNEIKGPEKYKFIHKDLGIEILTRHQLADKYDLSLLSVSRVIQGRRNHTKGWHLNELQPLWGSTIYKFWHKKYGIEELAQYELANKYNLTRKGVSNIVQGKACSTKGWYLKKEYTQEDLLIAWENFTKLMEPK